MDTNTVQLIESFGKKMDGYFSALAAKAGVATDHFYPLFVRQQTIEGIITLIALTIGVVITILMFKMALKNVDNNYDGYSRNNHQGEAAKFAKTVIGFVLGSVFTLLLIIMIGTDGMTTVGKLLNPEYYAVNSLVQMVK